MTLVVRLVTTKSCSIRPFCRFNFCGDTLTIATRFVTKSKIVSVLETLSLVETVSVFSEVTTEVNRLGDPGELACSRTKKSRAVLLVRAPALRFRILVVVLKVEGTLGVTARNCRLLGSTL